MTSDFPVIRSGRASHVFFPTRRDHVNDQVTETCANCVFRSARYIGACLAVSSSSRWSKQISADMFSYNSAKAIHIEQCAKSSASAELVSYAKVLDG